MRVLLVAVVAALTAPHAASAVSFKSPSGKIECTLSRMGASCYNDKTLATPPPPGATDCGSGASAVVVDRFASRLECVGNPFFARRRLAYGQTLRRGRYTCTSRRSGMRCRNRRSGHGFRLNRDGWRLF